MIEGLVNEILTGPFQRYRMFGSVAGFVAPRIDVTSSKIRTRAQDPKLQTTYKGIVTNHTDPAGRVSIGYNDNPVGLEPRRLRADIADLDRADAENMVGDIDMDHMDAIAYGLNIRWELNVKDAATKAASFDTANKVSLTTGNKVQDSTFDFRERVEEAVNAVAERGGTMINSIVIPPKVIPKLVSNPNLKNTMRYSTLMGLTKPMLAEYLSGDSKEWTADDIMVPRCRYNAGDEVNRNFKFIWDNTDILLFHRAEPNVAIQDPFFMATYTFEGTPIVSTRRSAVDFIGDVHHGVHWQWEEVENYDCAYLIADAI